jgi:hypothetical protein
MRRVMERHWIVLTVLAAVIGQTAVAVAAEITLERTDAGAKITVDGQPFADYVTKSGHQPVIWPIIGPGGQAMTRQYPLGPALESEKNQKDHLHHRSLWFNHGDVNGKDFWLEPEDVPSAGKDNQIVHREFVEPAEADNTGSRIVTRNDWTSDGKKVCEDVRTIEFGADGNGRWIDFAVEVTASESELVFGDTKEGAFGVRVAGTMAVDAKKGGKIVNSLGQENAVAWGQPAEWVDYRGPVDGKPAGITIFDMPDSFRHPTRWHVRTYGLFAANPFGERDFSPGRDAAENRQGEAKLAKGEKLRLHYRVLFHRGDLTPEQLQDVYMKYAGGKQE